ncbi:regulator of G-protein signaling 7 isoform X5 [Equus caballus]|uniref:regulator of G-protein signaling 7 isoform X5 n=1 Tax=Equus caballus TaxID=9796 RepID=UPI000C9E9B62|nr:regulator of G-protein signaling 7 isoform X6 [Equus caballus]XP_023488208.1 regulator of G-protein signaling 7 isoform X6 [Equus caballus]XP_023488209.1 regulator of G-protein signaling 7 isoform X6 [Equus caballus]XP_023488210.1 regulator of G-protein signaling 7 isoform X6 [Equus caballus]
MATSFRSQITSSHSRMMVLFTGFKHPIFGHQIVGSRKTQTTRFTSAREQCRIRRGWSWQTTKLRAWPGCRGPSPGSGSSFSCKQKHKQSESLVDKKRDKIERKILDSQERAFWDVHRPVPGCVNTTEVDIKKSSRMRNPHKTRKSVYGLQNDIRSHSPTHTPTPETKAPTEDELQQQIKYWQIQLDRHRLKMSKVADSLLSYTEQYLEYDPFLVPPDPSNPWLSDDTTFWELEASKEPSQQRVKRWGFGMDEALKDPVGREQFLKFLESEFSSENLRFWLAVEDLKKRPIREVPSRVQEIWQEFLAPGAPSAINLDSKSYDKTTQNVKEPGRYTFEDAQEHIYKLMKSDSYPRFIRSSAYQELLQAKKKGRNIPIFPCHKNCTPTLRASTNLL